MQRFTLAELPVGVQVPVVRLPAGSIVTSGELRVTTAFNDTTDDDAIDIGDITDSDRYTATAAAANALGVKAFDFTAGGTPYQNTAGTWLTLTYTATTGDASTGAGYVIVRYIVEGRFNEIEPEDAALVPADDATPA